jgi:hypothetical protein
LEVLTVQRHVVYTKNMNTTAATKTTYRVTFVDGTTKTFKSALPVAFALVTSKNTIWAKSATRQGVEAAAVRDAGHLALLPITTTVVPVEVV